jgi:hypothetical protein
MILPASAVFGAILLSDKAFSITLWHFYSSMQCSACWYMEWAQYRMASLFPTGWIAAGVSPSV